MGARTSKMPQDHVANPFPIFQDLIIPEAQNGEPLPAQVVVTPGIGFTSLMVPAIDLDHQPAVDAGEIRDEGPDRMLAAEPAAGDLFFPQSLPQVLFDIGHRLAQVAGKLGFLDLAHPCAPASVWNQHGRRARRAR